eukprot:s731_g11.t1
MHKLWGCSRWNLWSFQRGVASNGGLLDPGRNEVASWPETEEMASVHDQTIQSELAKERIDTFTRAMALCLPEHQKNSCTVPPMTSKMMKVLNDFLKKMKRPLMKQLVEQRSSSIESALGQEYGISFSNNDRFLRSTEFRRRPPEELFNAVKELKSGHQNPQFISDAFSVAYGLMDTTNEINSLQRGGEAEFRVAQAILLQLVANFLGANAVTAGRYHLDEHRFIFVVSCGLHFLAIPIYLGETIEVSEPREYLIFPKPNPDTVKLADQIPCGLNRHFLDFQTGMVPFTFPPAIDDWDQRMQNNVMQTGLPFLDQEEAASYFFEKLEEVQLDLSQVEESVIGEVSVEDEDDLIANAKRLARDALLCLQRHHVAVHWVSEIVDEIVELAAYHGRIKQEQEEVSKRWDVQPVKKNRHAAKRERKKQNQQGLSMEAKVQSEPPSATQRLRGILNDFTNKVFKYQHYRKAFHALQSTGLLAHIGSEMVRGSHSVLHGNGMNSASYGPSNSTISEDGQIPK